MTSTEKVKKKKGKKNKKSQKAKDKNPDILEKVMDSIEMAGASMDFIESDNPESPEPEEISETDSVDSEILAADGNTEELDEALSDDDTVEIATLDPENEEKEEIKAADSEAGDEIDDDSENLELIEDESKEFVEQNQALSIIESLLFSSERPLGLGTFKQVFKGTTFKSKDIKKALEELQSEYANPARGVSLEEINGGWQLRTKVDNLDFLRRLGKAKPFKLSGPALEVMSIIAYKQPIIKSEVDDIRGVESGHLVRALMEKNLVAFQGKSELPGKPMQYGTTRKFLEIFGLRNLRELPSLDEIDQLLPDGIGIEEEDEKLSDVTDSMSESYDGNYSEGEEELLKIEDTLSGIDTSSEFFEQEKIRQKEKRDRDRAKDIREAMDVGEEVEAKDAKWLERYDKKMEEQAEEARLAAEQAENIETPPETEAQLDELIGSADSLTGELSKLTTQNLIDADTMANDEAMELKDSEQENFEEPSGDTLEISEPTEENQESHFQGELHPDNHVEITEPLENENEIEAQSPPSETEQDGSEAFETFDPFANEEQDPEEAEEPEL